MKKQKRQITLICSLVLVLTLIVSACDMGTSAPAGVSDGVGEDVNDPTIVVEEPAMEESTVEATEGVTGTDGMTATQSVTDTTMASETEGAQSWSLGYELINRSFTNVDGEVSGTIDDLIVDLRSGYILLAEIEYGGFLDIGDREILVPLNAFRESAPGEELTLAFNEQVLEAYPDLSDNSPRLNDPTWYEDIGAFWNDVVSTDEAGMGMDMSTVDVTSDPIVRATDLLGFSLIDLGSGVGTIQNMLINLEESRARYLMVSYGTGAASDDPFLIPFSAIDIVDIDTTQITLDADVTMETLQLAPRFDRLLFQDEVVEGAALTVDDAYIDEVDVFWEEQGVSAAP